MKDMTRKGEGLGVWSRLLRSVGATMLVVPTLCSSQPPSAQDEITIAQQLAVPSYIHPGVDPDAWTRLMNSAPGTVGIGVANVINGPDYLPFANWASVIQGAHAAGIRMIGYVDTGYLGTTGQRTRLGSTAVADWISQIERDINAWYAFYGPELGGIFFDQVQNACGPTPESFEWADLYRELSDYVKRSHPDALTVANPGIVVPECYENSADVLITFEGSYASYAAETYEPLSWDPVDPKKIWHIVYGAASPAEMEDAIALSKSRQAGFVFVTDDVLANPYDTLPAPDYWAAEQVSIAPGGSPGVEPPSIPAGLEEISTMSTTTTFAWEASSASSAPLVGYDIYRDGQQVASVRSDVTTFTATTVSPDSSYLFTVAARDAAGNVSLVSDALEIFTDGPGSPPPAPDRLTADSTSYTSTTLSWTGVSQALGWHRSSTVAYEVYQNDKIILRLPATTTSVTVGGLAPGSAYTFAVRAVGTSGSASFPSAPVVVTTETLPEGGMIQAPTVSQSPDTLTFSADFVVPFAFRRVFIVTGNVDNACWWSGSSPQLCADYVIENERLLKYAGSGGDWNWQSVRSVEPVVDGFTYTWTISPADLRSVVAMDAVFNANGYAPNTYCGPSVTCTSTGPPLPYEILGTVAAAAMVVVTDVAPELISAVPSAEMETS